MIKYTEQQLLETKVTVLREILGAYNGIPGNKPKSQLVNEILKAQNGEVIEERTKHGRPRLDGVNVYKEDVFTPLTLSSPVSSEENLSLNNNVYGSCVGKTVEVSGTILVKPNGKSLLLNESYKVNEYSSTFVSDDVLLEYNLASGDFVNGVAVVENGVKVLKMVTKIHGEKVESISRNALFETLSVCYPNEKFNLNFTGDNYLKIIDLLSPIGKGQRLLISAPERAGKSTMLKKLANVIELSNQNVITLSLLINRRPEEVFEYKRNVKGEVISIGYEEDGKQQVEVAEVILAKAKRLVELGKDVVMFIDDVTNLVKAYDYVNSLVDTTGSESLRAIKKYLSSARNIENGGSLTILAIADVNSKRAEFLCSELKGVVNSEITLSTELANRGIYPSIIISDTFTRNANYLTGGKDFQLSYKLREIDDIREVIRLIDEGEEF